MHTKAANKFHSIMSQMTEKKDKKCKAAQEDSKPTAVDKVDKKAAKEKEKEAAKEKEKAKKEEKLEKK